MGKAGQIAQFDQFVGQEMERPAPTAFGWLGTGQRNQHRLLLRIELTFSAWPGALNQCQVKALFHEASLGPIDRRGSDVQRLGNGFVGLARIRQEQDLRPLHLAGTWRATARHGDELLSHSTGSAGADHVRCSGLESLAWLRGEAWRTVD